MIFDVGTDVPAARVHATVPSALAPLVGTTLVIDRKPHVYAVAIENGDIHYRVNTYATLGPNSELPIKNKVVEALQGGFEAADIKFISTSAMVLKILAGTTAKLRKPN